MPTLISRTQRVSQSVHQSWTIERKIDLVMQGLLKRRPVTELCREAGISTKRYYQWRNQFIDAARSGLAYPVPERQSMEEHIRQLEAENAGLQTKLRILQDVCIAD